MALPKEELKALFEEIRLSEALNEQEVLPQMQEALERYTGRHIPSIAVDWTIVLNEVYPVISFGLPSIFFRTPTAFIKPRNKTFIGKRRNPRSGKMEERVLDATKSARTQEALINYQLQEMRYKHEIRKVNLDAHLFRHAVLWHGYKGDFGMTNEQSMFIQKEHLWVQRISPLRFLKDPSVPLRDLQNARWIGRSFEVPLPNILEDKKLSFEKGITLKGKTGFGEMVGTKEAVDFLRGGGSKTEAAHKFQPLLDRASKEFRESRFARFITLYEILIRPTPKQRSEGNKGTLLLLTFEQFKPLRENPWPYKAEGWPAKVLMFNDVPEQHFGMADIDVYGTIADHKNLVINQQIRNAEQTNKTWVGIAKETADEEDVEKVRAGQSTVIFFDGDDARKRMFVASAAGAGSSELYTLDGRIDQNLQDKSGVTDLKRGTPPKSGEESAASVRERIRGGSARPAYRQDIMADFLKESVGFLLDLTKQYVPIRQAIRIVGSPNIEWSDDFTEDEIQADVDVELDIQSMLPESPETELQNIGQILALMINAIGSPQISQKLLQEGRTFNLTPIIETMLHRLRIRDPEVFRSIRPEESEGFAAIKELRAAQANINAAVTGQPLPDPPKEGQDHRTRLEIYIPVAQMLEQLGQISEQLGELITQTQELLQAQQSKDDAARLKAGRAGALKPFAGNGVAST